MGLQRHLANQRGACRWHWADEPTRANGHKAVSGAGGSDPTPPKRSQQAIRPATGTRATPTHRLRAVIRLLAARLLQAETGRYACVIFKLTGKLRRTGAESERYGGPQRGVH